MSDVRMISASQIETFSDCNRKWWFLREMRLPEVPRGYFTFGTVLHAVLERWLSADEQGRVPLPNQRKYPYTQIHKDGPLKGQQFGQPVDLYPEGWTKAVERDGREEEVTPNEAKLIKQLVEQAIERGIVQRFPGRQVERELRVGVLDGVVLIGYVDLFHPGDEHEPGIPQIHDHKTFSESGSRYLKQPGPRDAGGMLTPITAPYSPDDGTSPNCVGHNQQMLTYAAATSIADGWAGPVYVRHNQFPKYDDGKGPRFVDAVVSGERVAAHWEEIKATAEAMVRVGRIKRWDDTPPPPPGSDACSRYGGCPFAGICGRRETTEHYRERVERQIEQRAESTRPNLTLKPRKRRKTGGTKDMDIFARATKQRTARAEAPPAAINGGAPAEPEPTNLAVAGAPPWAMENCPSCKGAGWNSRGRPCPICDKTARQQGRPSSGMYVIAGDPGERVAAAREEHAEALEELGAPLEWAEGPVPAGALGDVPVEAPGSPQEGPAEAADDEPQDEPEAQEAPAQEEPEAQEKEDPRAAARRALLGNKAPKPAGPAVPPAVKAKAKQEPAAPKEEAEPVKSPGRPRVGVTLLIGAAQLRGPDRPSTTIQEVLESVGAELAADMGASSYWELDSFKRRDRLRQRADVIAERLGRVIVMVPGLSDPDAASLTAALMPYAELVIEGLR